MDGFIYHRVGARPASVNCRSLRNSMTDDPPQALETASREATNWLILLQDDPDDPDLQKAFSAWLNASPLHSKAWQASGQVDIMIRDTPPVFKEVWGHQKTLAKSATDATVGRPMRSVRNQNRPHRGWGSLVGLAVAACLLLAFLPTISRELQSDYVTGTAETRIVTLQDGSTVTMAPETSLAIDFTTKERRIDLLSGSAYFSVEKNSDRPFRVFSGDLVTTVTGTQFAVRLNDYGHTVAVSEGSVRIDYHSATQTVSETLIAGQSASIDRLGAVALRVISPSQVAAWREDRLVVQDEPLGAVLDQLQDYLPGAVILANPGLADRPITGYYSLTDPENAVRAVALAHNLTLWRVTPWFLILSEK
jgi:transmembrane sensor